jgi:DNA-binding NarL/FixJ family response regulator
MDTLLLICDAKSSAREKLTDLAATKGLFNLNIATPADSIRSNLLQDPSIKAVVFDCQMLDRNELALLIKLKQLNDALPILVLADQISLYSYRKVDMFKRMVAVQKPVDDFMLLRLLQKLVTDKNFQLSPSPRFITDQSVRVVHLKTGLLLPTRMRNYSTSGAFLEYRGISVKPGDELQIQISQSRAENLSVRAKVIWTRDGEHSRSPVRGLGVQFKHFES